MSAASDVKFGDWIEQGFELYKNNFAVLLLASLIAVVISMVSVMILAGPMCVGLVMVTLRLLDGSAPEPQATDVFQGFNRFLDGFLYALLMFVGGILLSTVFGLIPCVGPVVGPFVTCAVLVLFMYGPFRIADAGSGFWPACQESMDVVKPRYWPLLGLYVIASVLASLGGLLCGIGVILTLPVSVCILAASYRDLFGGHSGGEDVVEPVADDTNANTSAETQAANGVTTEESGDAEPKE